MTAILLNRTVSLFGVVLIVGALICWLNLSKDQVKLVNNLIREFTWSGKNPHLDFKLLQSDVKEGVTIGECHSQGKHNSNCLDILIGIQV